MAIEQVEAGASAHLPLDVDLTINTFLKSFVDPLWFKFQPANLDKSTFSWVNQVPTQGKPPGYTDAITSSGIRTLFSSMYGPKLNSWDLF